MITKLKNAFLTLALIVGSVSPAVALMPLLSATASASGTNCASTSGSASSDIGQNSIAANAANGAGNAAGSGATINCNGDTKSTLQNIAHKVANIFSLLIGGISIIMIIYGGFRYITSGGSSERVSAAKNVILYA